jgi:autotransporter-associated beta strand protein
MRRNKGFVLVATAACLASAGMTKADVGLLTSLADWGGSAYAPGGYSANGTQMGAANNQNPGTVPTGEAKQFGNQGVGFYVSGNGSVANIDVNSNTVLYTASAATTTITTNGLLNLNNDFAAPNGGLDQPTIGTSWQGLTGGVGGATITGYPGGVDTIGTGELLLSPASTKIATTLQAGSAFAIDFTTPLGGTTLSTATGDYYSVAVVGNTSINGVYTRFFTGNADPHWTQATKNVATTYTGDSYGDQGAFVVNNGTYYTAYMPYNQGAAQTANSNVNNNSVFTTLTSLQLDPEVNANPTGTYAAALGNINFSNYRLITPTWAPINTGTTTTPILAGGSWSTGNTSVLTTNWIGGVPNASGASAQFTSLVNGPATVTLDAAETVGSIIFNNLTNSFTIAPGTGGTLTLDNTVNAAPATITDLGGAHSITAPITLTSSVTVTATNAADNVTLSGNISGAGGLTSAGAGTTTIGGMNSYGGGTTVNAGTLVVSAYTAIPTASPLSVAAGAKAVIASGAEASLSTPVNLSSLTLTGNGTLDIMNNLVLITDSPAQATSVLAALKTGHASGWAGPGGIVSTTAATHAGYGVAFGQHSFIASIPSGEIQISYTLYGDINQDGVVNGTDFGILAGNFGHSVTGGWEQGDLNYDGTVNGTDFGLLAGNFGKSATGRAVTLPQSEWVALDAFAAQHGLLADVPEPASLGVLGVVGAAMMSRRRRN